MSSITWSNKVVRLGAIKPNPSNPRYIEEQNAVLLGASLEEFGHVKTLVVGPPSPDGVYPLYDGHSRYWLLVDQGGPDQDVEVRQSSRPLSDEELRKLVMMLHAKGVTGRWDLDVVAATYNIGELESWGFETWELYPAGARDDSQPPDEFPAYDDESIETDYCCPACGYEWSGKPK